ncbi:hypothetical protein BJV82DRAFT_653507 [Fennellomyces sp. T-0311]|nr:hypothetical protein BJV82DRAFT_653507 [Fennellomyces sp. T-0311]
MSSPPPKHSLSSPTNSGKQTPVLPTPSCSSSASEVTKQLRRELEQQIAEKEKQLQDSSSGIGKGVLTRQIKQLKERLQEMDRRQQQQQQQTATLSPRQQPRAASPARRSQSPASQSGDDDLSPATLEKLRNLERDLGAYRGYQQLSPNLSGHRKDKLLGQRTGLDPLPSPSTSTMLPPAHGHDSTSLLPLPPPPTGSTPTKRRSKVPNADRRNTDIEFATEIGQGLLMEVRKMQALVQEKDDQLKALQAQKADLERAAESMAKQLRQKEENEEKLKEETWNLELAKQELTISVTELQQNLSKANAEQKRMQEHMNELTSEIEHMRDREEKLSSKLEAMKQKHEQDMANLRRHSAGLQRDKTDHIKQIEALSSELAIAKAQSKIAKRSHSDLKPAAAAEPSEEKASSTSTPTKEGSTPGTTPPPSPKQTPSRNQQLEVETLKTSLAHAHRMVSNLRSNLHKEKTEKFELKKLLTESQETIEQLQNDPRLWVDAGYPKSGSQNAPESSGSATTRRHRKGKRRVAVSKPRIARYQKGGESLDDSSDVDDRPKQKGPYYSSQSEDDDGDDEYYDDVAPDAGFTSLDSELSKSQQRPPPTVSVEPPANDNAPRTLGDELSAAFAGPDTEPRGSDAAVQTGDFEFQQSSTSAVDIAPVQVHDQAIQCMGPSTADAETQCAQPEYVEHGTQPDKIDGVHAAVQHEPAATHDQGVQHALPGVDQFTQSNIAQVVNSGVQSDSASTADASVQSEPSVTKEYTDVSVQSDALDTTDASIQSDPEVAKETADVSVQSEPPVVAATADASIQSDPFDTTDASIQSDPKETSDVYVQSDIKETSDVFVQSDTKETSDVYVQSDPPVAKETSDVQVQSEPPVGNDASVQSETADAREIATQSDAPHVKDSSVQYMMEYKDAEVQVNLDPPSSNNTAGAIAAGGALGGLGALAAKAFGNWGSSDNAAQDTVDEHASLAKDRSTAEGADKEAPSSELANVKKEESVEDASPAQGSAENAKPAETHSIASAGQDITTRNLDKQESDDSSKALGAGIAAGAVAAAATTTTAGDKTDNVKTDDIKAADIDKIDRVTNGDDAKAVDKKPSPADSATDLPKQNADDDKVFSKAETDAMIAAAVAAAVAKSKSDEDAKRHASELTTNHTIANKPSLADLAGRDNNIRPESDVPARPTSPPPAHLLSRVGQGSTISSGHRSSIGSLSTADKGKGPARSQVLRAIPQHNSLGRPPSSLSSLSVSEPRMSTGSYDATSMRTEDPAHIGLITQTMIGDWLWKYTRKSVGGALSDHRHRRYFWIHPYTRTLYWSNKAPGTHGNESKAKSARIEGISAVPDHNHPPSPDVPNMSLLIQTTNRVIKLTAPNMDKHNLWYEALSYLVSRSAPSDQRQTQQARDTASSNGVRSIIRKPSVQRIQGLFRSGSKTETPTDSHVHDHDDDTDDEALEDVRMCCDGKHHVSKLERDHVDHRPYYRKIHHMRHSSHEHAQPQQVN